MSWEIGGGHRRRNRKGIRLAKRFPLVNGNSVTSAQLLEVSIVRVGTMLRLESGAWSMVKRVKGATIEPHPFSSPSCLGTPPRHLFYPGICREVRVCSHTTTSMHDDVYPPRNPVRLGRDPWSMMKPLLRGTIVNRTYGAHKNLYIPVFLSPIFWSYFTIAPRDEASSR